MNFRERLHNLTFIPRLGKFIQPRLGDILSEPLTWEMIAALDKLSNVPDDRS